MSVEPSLEDRRDEIFYKYTGDARTFTAKRMFESMPRNVLKDLIDLLKTIARRGPVGDNKCPACGHWHGDANWDHNFTRRMLDRAKQVYAGIWIEKCRHGRICGI